MLNTRTLSRRSVATLLVIGWLGFLGMAAEDGRDGSKGDRCASNLIAVLDVGERGGAGGFEFPTSLAAFNAGGDDEIYPFVFMPDVVNHVVYLLMGTGEDMKVYILAGQLGMPGFQDGSGGAAQFNHPTDVAVDANGIAYVADTVNCAIRMILPDGSVYTLAGSGVAGYADGPGAQALFSYPRGVAVAKLGGVPIVLVADTGNNLLRAIRLSDNQVFTLGQLNNPKKIDWWAAYDVAYDDNGYPTRRTLRDRGYIFVADDDGIQRWRENADGSLTVNMISDDKAKYVFSDDALNLYFVPQEGNTIKMAEYRGDGYAQPTELTICDHAINSPQAAIGAFGGMMVVDLSDNRLQVFTSGIIGGATPCPRCGPRGQNVPR